MGTYQYWVRRIFPLRYNLYESTLFYLCYDDERDEKIIITHVDDLKKWKKVLETNVANCFQEAMEIPSQPRKI